MIFSPEIKIASYLDAAFRGPTVNQAPKPKPWFSTLLGLTNLLRPKITPFAHLFNGLHNTKIAVVGLDAAGKTTLLRNHISLDCTRSGQDVAIRKPLIGLIVKSVVYPNDVVFFSMDVGGSAPKLHRAIERAVVGAGHAVVWVVDANDRDRLVETREELYRFCRTADDEREGGKRCGVERAVPILVLLTKKDLEVCGLKATKRWHVLIATCSKR
jgi:signal recognition particle receptor subunit beta